MTWVVSKYNLAYWSKSRPSRTWIQHPLLLFDVSYFWNEDSEVSHYFSDKDRFVTGSKDGHVTIWTNSTPTSKRIFTSSKQWNNRTLVKYINRKIYAISYRHSKLTVMNMNLKVIKVFDYEFRRGVCLLVASQKYVAVGDLEGRVIVFDGNGNLVLVSESSDEFTTFRPTNIPVPSPYISTKILLRVSVRLTRSASCGRFLARKSYMKWPIMTSTMFDCFPIQH